LRPQYGSCNFEHLRNVMNRYGFTTNIAFIPWNWRRTSRSASEFFKSQACHFSISIHGCDHIGSEFGTTSQALLNHRAQLAQFRMQQHKARTGIEHEPVMVFPQGVFSSSCPPVLKRNGFLAAVNTETVPVDLPNAATRVRDVWDIAIMAYGDFPIFTRRYAFHGLENFAFDLLLGKPCLIVCHHDFFRDGCAEVIELIEKVNALEGRLRWRTLGGVIQHSCRRRANGMGCEKVEMYGTELVVNNDSNRTIEVRVQKREHEAQSVGDVLSDGRSTPWSSEADLLIFRDEISPNSKRQFRIIYDEPASVSAANRSVGLEISVAARRILSEWRDNYLSKSRFLNASALSVKGLFSRVN